MQGFVILLWKCMEKALSQNPGFVPGAAFQTISPRRRFSNNLSQVPLFKQFVPGAAFQTIRPRRRLSNNLSQAPLSEQFLPVAVVQTIFPMHGFSNIFSHAWLVHGYFHYRFLLLWLGFAGLWTISLQVFVALTWLHWTMEDLIAEISCSGLAWLSHGKF